MERRVMDQNDFETTSIRMKEIQSEVGVVVGNLNRLFNQKVGRLRAKMRRVGVDTVKEVGFRPDLPDLRNGMW